MMVNSSPTTITNNVDANNMNSTSLRLKPSANLSFLFNQLIIFSPEQEHEPKNVVNFNYYDIGKS